MAELFKVKFDFTATDPIELTVKTDEVLRGLEPPTNGWVSCEVQGQPRRRGFVPVTYVEQIREFSRGPTATGNKPQSARQPSPPQAAGMDRYAQQQQADERPNQQAATPHNPAGAIMVSSAIPNPAAVVEGFMKNEVYFRQLMKQRQETLAKIESALSEVSGEVAQCRDRNSQVTRKLKDLDSLIVKERRKWKERADEERLVMAQKSAPQAAPMQTTTTSYRATTREGEVSRRL